MRKKQRSTFLLESLEARLLFSADMAPVPVDGGNSGAELASDLEISLRPDSDGVQASDTAKQERREVIFVDEAIDDVDQLIADLESQRDKGRQSDIVALDSDHDGIAQITAYLSQQQDVAAVHILSHGADGEVILGNGRLNATTLDGYAEAIEGWQRALSNNADLLFYGCNLAASDDGQDLVNSLTLLSGADVAASDDVTGSAKFGGDWSLEYAKGEIETAVAVNGETQQNWSGVLATYNVTTTADGGPGSLRQAILDANDSAEADVISLPSGTYLLVGELEITSELAITGADAGTTIIDGNDAARVFHLIGDAANLTLNDLTVQGGNSNKGSGIYVDHNLAQLTAARVIITGNIAGNGAGIFNDGTMALTDVVVSNNGDDGTHDGGGIYNTETANLNRVTISDNRADYGGGIFNDGTMTLTDVVISNNGDAETDEGGGIFNHETADLNRVTISGNQADYGGGIHNDNHGGVSLSLTNVTVSGNDAEFIGGGLHNDHESATIVNSTFTLNSANNGGGISNNGGTVSIQNTIVAGNTGSNPDVESLFNSLGFNLIGEKDGSNGFTDGVNDDQVGTTVSPLDPLLGPLQNNGGFTPTHALLAGSPAIDAGDDGVGLTDDQRRYVRPIDGDGDATATIDIGAFEYASVSSSPIIAADDSYATDENDMLIVAADGVLENDALSGPFMVTAGATLEYLAWQDIDGNNVWEDTTGIAGYDLDFTGATVIRDTLLNNVPAGISAAYAFDGSGGGEFAELMENLAGDPSNNSASFEFWIRPSDASGREIIFDTGSASVGHDGAMLRLNGSTLEWVVWTGGPGNRVSATQDIATEIASGEFIQVVATVNPGNLSTVSLRINGGSAATGSNLLVTDWASFSAPTGVGAVGGISTIPMVPAGEDPFIGEIAAFRFYEFALSDGEVQQNYDAMRINVASHDPTSASGATVVVNADGGFSYDPGTLFDYLGSGEIGTDTFSYMVEDASGNQDTATVSITVNGVNDNPTGAGSLTTTSLNDNAGATNLFSALTVSDADTGENDLTLRITLSDDTAGTITGGGFADDGGGVYTLSGLTVTQANTALDNMQFTPTNNSGPAGNFTTDISVDVDDQGGAGYQSVLAATTVTITRVNDAPVLGNNNLTITEGATVIFDSSMLSATDVDNADASLTFNVSGVTAGHFAFSSDTTTPITSFNQSDITAGTVVFVHDGSEAAPSYSVSVTDGTDSTAAVPAAITFTNVNDPPTLGNNNLTITEGATVIFDSSRLSATDVDNADASLTFNVSGVTAGHFAFSSDTATPITSFNQSDITAGTVVFVHDNSEAAPSYSVSVTDGTDSTAAVPAAITFTNVNDPPTLGNNNLTITEGATVIFDSSMLSATDVDNADASLTFNVSGVTAGHFAFSSDTATPITSFNQSDITAGTVVFVHDNSEAAPSYSVSVTDGTDSTAAVPAAITFTNVNDPPTLGNNNLTITEGATVIFDSSRLSATDVDNADASLTFNVSGVTAGHFAFSSDTATPITSFDQSDITAGTVVFVHDGSEAAPSYSVSVTDGTDSTAAVPAAITFTNVNDPPTLGNNNLTITEGATVIFDSSMLSATDVDNADASLTFNVSGVTAGHFAFSSDTATPITSFNQSDITAGTVVFVHDNSEAAPSYSVSVTDGTDSTAAVPAAITFTNVNDPPTLGNNNLTITEGATVIFDSSRLSATDVDNADASLTFNVSGVTAGHFAFSSDTTTPITSFNQSDITAGTVVFVHDGSEAAPSYSVSVTDGTDSTAAVPAAITFTNVNDPPTLGNNNLTITEGATVIFDSSRLSATDVDNADASLTFNVSGVTAGHFAFSSDTATPITSFNQSDITAGTVVFVHDNSEAAPSYSVSVTDGTDSTAAVPAAITFTNVNDPPTLGNNNLTITEGATVLFDSSMLSATDVDNADASLTFNVSGVTAGHFAFSSDTTTPITSFNQSDITAGTVVFVHDGSEAAPSYSVSVTDGTDSTAAVPAAITFTNVNDAPTLGNNNLTITEGATVIFDSSMLSATDVDNADASLTFNVSGVTAGHFAFSSDTTTPITSFNQSDITAGTVVFVHDGSEAAPSYSVSVTDGTDNTGPAPAVINFTNINDPGTVAIDNTTPAQGDTLTANVIDPDGTSGAISYQWFSDGVAIGSATGKTYATTQADVGTIITVTALYTDDLGTAESLTSAPTAAVTNINDPGSVTIDNATPAQGDALTANVIDADGASGAISYQWFSDGVTIGGAIGKTYTTTQADVGTIITVTALYTDDLSTVESLASAPTAPVTNLNEAPVAVNDNLNVVEDNSITFSSVTVLLGNDTDIDGDSLTISGFTQPANGMLADNGDGTLTYTPAGNFNGTDNFTYTISDGNGATASGTAIIVVAPVGDTPQVTNVSTNAETQSGLIYANRNANDGTEVSHFKISGITNGTLYLADGLTQIDNGDYISAEQGLAGLKFTPVAGSTADGSFNVESSEDGVSVASQSGIATSIITVMTPASLASESEQSPPKSDPEQVVIEEIVEEEEESEDVEDPVDEADVKADADNMLSVETPQLSKAPGTTKPSFNPGIAFLGRGDLDSDDDKTPDRSTRLSPQTLKMLIETENLGELKTVLKKLGITTLSPEDYELVRSSLDAIKDEMGKEILLGRTVLGSAIATSVGLSAGYVVWMLKGGSLLASLLSSLPAWQLADPLAILVGKKEDEDDDDDSLKTIIEEGSGRDKDKKSKASKFDNLRKKSTKR